MNTSRVDPAVPPSHIEAKKRSRRIGLPASTLDDTTLVLLWVVVIAGLAALIAFGIFRLIY